MSGPAAPRAARRAVTWLAQIAGTVAALGAAVPLAVLLIHATWSARLAGVRETLQASVARERDRVLADQRELAGHWLFGPGGGQGDASVVLTRRAGWRRGHIPVLPARSGVPGWVASRITDKKLAEIQNADLSGVDLGWMRELPRYDHWDLEHEGSPVNDRPAFFPSAPDPDFYALQTAGRARLLQGIQGGRVDEAVVEVRALARLCASTEHELGLLFAYGILQAERAARKIAVDRGLDVSGWPQAPEGEPERLHRAMTDALAFFQLVEADPSMEQRIVVGRCAALRQGLMVAALLRPELEERHASRFTALDLALAASPRCRVKNLRRVWTDREGELPMGGEAMCAFADPDEPRSAICGTPAWVFAIPLAKEGWGEAILAEVAWDHLPGDKGHRTPSDKTR